MKSLKSRVANFFDRRKVQSPRKQILCALQKFGFKFVFMKVGGYFFAFCLSCISRKTSKLFHREGKAKKETFFLPLLLAGCAEGRFRRLPHFHWGRPVWNREKNLITSPTLTSPQKPIGINLSTDRINEGERPGMQTYDNFLSLSQLWPGLRIPFRFSVFRTAKKVSRLKTPSQSLEFFSVYR